MWQHLFLLASTSDRLSAAARYLTRPSTYRENLLFILFASAIAAIWIALFLWDRLRRSSGAEKPQEKLSLFEQLCRAHRLDRQDIAYLTDAAQQRQLPSPVYLFVQPEHLGELGGEGMPKSSSYRALRERLFGPLE